VPDLHVLAVAFTIERLLPKRFSYHPELGQTSKTPSPNHNSTDHDMAAAEVGAVDAASICIILADGLTLELEAIHGETADGLLRRILDEVELGGESEGYGQWELGTGGTELARGYALWPVPRCRGSGWWTEEEIKAFSPCEFRPRCLRSADPLQVQSSQHLSRTQGELSHTDCSLLSPASLPPLSSSRTPPPTSHSALHTPPTPTKLYPPSSRTSSRTSAYRYARPI
jgi:hypothetical protein